MLRGKTMSNRSTPATLTRRLTRGFAAAAFAVVVGATGTATAQDAPDTPDTPELPDPQPITSNPVLSTGDAGPGPFTYQTFSAQTVSPGVTRVTLDEFCNLLNPDLCEEDYAQGGKISWINTSTGKSGEGEILAGDSKPGSSIDLETGSGPVVLTISSPSDSEDAGPPIMVKGGGLIHVG